MQLITTPYKIRCEIGACKNFAFKTVVPSRVGMKSRLHICQECMKELYTLLGKEIVPSSIETLKKAKSKAVKNNEIR